MKAKKSSQKLTVRESKINEVAALEQITKKDIEALSKAEKDRLMEILTEKFNQLKGEDHDRFYKKIEQFIGQSTKNQLWEYNHNKIIWAITTLMQDYGRMPTKTEIATKTELSRQTVHKHFNEFIKHPLYLEHLEQYNLMTSKVLDSITLNAIKGDTGAAKLFFKIMGFMNGNTTPNNTLIQNQNNFIQINGTVLSQDSIKQLNPEQLDTIENILKTAIPNSNYGERK